MAPAKAATKTAKKAAPRAIKKAAKKSAANTSKKTSPGAPKKSVVSGKRLPYKFLSSWLEGRLFWNHQDWLDLLNALRAKGYESFTDSVEGQEAIGQYLESHRKTVEV